MYINTTGYYIPTTRIPNDYFSQVNGLSSDWILQRTGIQTRSRAKDSETIEYMCSRAVADALPKLPYDIREIDLIIFASYTPSDTIATVGHHIQREYNIENAKVFQISSACSSAINAMEIIYTFLSSEISSKALLICADRNSTYSDDADRISGHLWGDGAVAFFLSNTSYNKNEAEVLDITSQGLGHIGMGPKGVFLEPQKSGLQMPYGKDVFIHACNYIAQNTKNIVEDSGYTLEDLSFFIGHQANKRILRNVAKQLKLSDSVVLSNIEEIGNTGSASALLVYAQNINIFQSGDLICISVFGGGYSAGSTLLRIS